MASDKGFPSKDRETERDVPQDHVTAQPVRKKQVAKDVVSHQFMREADTDVVEAGSTTFVVNATSHSAQRGDIINFTSGNLSGCEVRVLSVTTNAITLAETLSEAPATSDTFQILRHKVPLANSDGTLPFTVTPIKFRLDGAEQEVVEDTVTPANNRPLPVKLASVTGDINITANDLHVQLEHTGANPDSVQIGDGTEILSITASGEAETFDSTAHGKLDSLLTELQLKADLSETQPISAASLPLPTGASTEATLASLEAKDFATQTTSAAILTELQLKADLSETQPVSLASVPLPTGAATEATLASIDGKDFATQTTLAALLTELALKADLTETQPVSAASLPLPTGAATETTLASLLTELQAKADLTETQPVSLASQPLPTGAATETTLASLLTELQLKADLTETQPVSAASLPLPSGAATEATLAAIDAKITAVDTTGKATEAKQDDIIAALNGRDVVEFVRNDYTGTSVTTGAYVELIASTAAEVKKLQIFDSSGQTLVIALGAAASEVDKLYVFPGGNGDVEVQIPAGSRVSIKAVSATADAGEISINLIG